MEQRRLPKVALDTIFDNTGRQDCKFCCSVCMALIAGCMSLCSVPDVHVAHCLESNVTAVLTSTVSFTQHVGQTESLCVPKLWQVQLYMCVRGQSMSKVFSSMRCVLQIYTLNEAGLICDHKQIWTNMTALQGIKLALTPCKRPD